MEAPARPRILILEPDRKTCAAVRRFAVKGCQGASVQATSSTLADALGDGTRLAGFDVVLAGADFAQDAGGARTFAALRAVAADPRGPAVILLTHGGSEYTAVQAIKAGAFDCIPRSLLGREHLLAAVQAALLGRRHAGGDPHAPSLFGYDVRRCLARNDNVSVHVAFSAERGCEVVLKVLHRDRGPLARDRNFERFVDEFKHLYDIDDPAVAHIYDFRVTSGYCYIAMEYFPAGHLGRRLGSALAPGEALLIAREVADALSIIHAAGTVHRDLKPGNVMLRDDGSLALIDFGLARSSGIAADGTAIVAGTPYYMSPEQARGEPTDERTDLYALGVMLFQMLTGEKPYTGPTATAILDLHCSAPIPRLPADLERFQPLVDRLLAKDMAQRFASARELTEALDRAGENEPAADQPFEPAEGGSRSAALLASSA